MVLSSATFMEIYIPRSGERADSITFHSEVTNKDYTYGFTPIPDTEKYHHFIQDLTGLPDGEYVYRVGEDRGVVRIGEYKADVKAYNHKEMHKEYNIYG